jgi:integrase
VSSIEATKRTAAGKPARDTKWRARYRDPQNRSRSQTFDRKGDAERFLERMGADIQRGDFGDPQLRRVRFEDWADQWWATAVHVKPSTRRGYRNALELHLRRDFGALPIGSIDRADVKAWAAKQLAAGATSKTVRNWLSVLILIFDEALDARAIRENPARGIKLPRAMRAEPVFFTAEEVEQLANAMLPKQYAFLVRFAAYTGMRPGEIAGLRVRRLDLLASRVEISETLIPVNGKLIAGATKTYATRTVPLPMFLRDQAGEYLAWLKATHPPLELDDYVFRAVKGGPLDNQRFREKIMRPALTRAGLPERFRFHDLRHTCASMLIGLGAHPKLVQERLGHSDIGVTMNVYGHVFPSLHENMTELLNDLHRQSASDVKSPSASVAELTHSDNAMNR